MFFCIESICIYTLYTYSSFWSIPTYAEWDQLLKLILCLRHVSLMCERTSCSMMPGAWNTLCIWQEQHEYPGMTQNKHDLKCFNAQNDCANDSFGNSFLYQKKQHKSMVHNAATRNPWHHLFPSGNGHPYIKLSGTWRIINWGYKPFITRLFCKSQLLTQPKKQNMNSKNNQLMWFKPFPNGYFIIVLTTLLAYSLNYSVPNHLPSGNY